MKLKIILTAIIFLTLANIAFASLALVSVQGTVRDAQTKALVTNELVDIELYDTGGGLLSSKVGIPLNSGVFSYMLGTTTPLTCGTNYILKIKVAGTEVGTYQFQACGGVIMAGEIQGAGGPSPYVLKTGDIMTGTLTVPALTVTGASSLDTLAASSGDFTTLTVGSLLGNLAVGGDLTVTGLTTTGSLTVTGTTILTGPLGGLLDMGTNDITNAGAITSNSLTTGTLTATSATVGGSDVCTQATGCGGTGLVVTSGQTTITASSELDINFGFTYTDIPLVKIYHQGHGMCTANQWCDFETTSEVMGLISPAYSGMYVKATTTSGMRVNNQWAQDLTLKWIAIGEAP